MKKVLVLAVCVVLAFLVACDEQPIGKENYSSENTVSVEAKKDEFGLNETAVFSDLKFTATEVRESNGTDFFTPEDGNVFVGVKFTVENISDKEQTVSTILLFDGYADDVKCSYSFTAACAFSDGTLDGTIAPGKKLVGWYALEVPENWSSLELQVKSNWLSNSSAKFIFAKQD